MPLSLSTSIAPTERVQYAGTSWLYMFFPTTGVSWLLTESDLSLLKTPFQRVGNAFAVVAALHDYALLVMFVVSQRDRRLSFTTRDSTWTFLRWRRKRP
ncbi:hypothetical protein PINS_up007951 [Pythium insidiosum]|nr:hypothetical protein PINS_up007951 [Pythium insidiosum]